MFKAVMTLYEPERACGKPAPRGTRVEMRHATTSPRSVVSWLQTCRQLSREMVDFVQRELLLDNWMRAQSQLDVAATTSDRPDHGPMGAYDACLP